MRILLEENLASCTTLDELQVQTLETLTDLRSDGFNIGYVAGPISCDGEEQIPANIHKLLAARTKIMHSIAKGQLIFTAPFIFSLEPYHNSYARLGLFNMTPTNREAALQRFWDNIIESGTIDGIYFVDGWQRSAGARRERLTASQNNVPVFDV